MPLPDIRFERTMSGYLVWCGNDHVADLHTRHYQGLQRNGSMLYEPMEHKHWAIRWVNVRSDVEFLKSLVENMPTEP